MKLASKKGKGGVGELIARITTPTPTLTNPGDRYRARVLASILVAAVPLGLLGIFAQLIWVPGFFPQFILGISCIAVLSVLLAVIRTHRYRLGAALAILAVIATCAIGGLTTPPSSAWWAYTLIALLLATFLLSLRAAAAITAVSLLTILAVGLYQDLTPHLLLTPLTFYIAFAPLLLVVAHQRNRLEDERQAQLRFHARLLERVQRQANIGHLLVDRAERTAAVSPLLREMLGLDSDETGIDALVDCFAEDRREELSGLIARADHPPRSLELETAKPGADGARRTVKLTLASGDDRGDQVVITVQDLTARVADERERLELLTQLHSARRLETLGSIARGIGHDFNNIITAIGANVELLEDATPDEARAMRAEIRASVMRAAGIVRHLFEYTNPDSVSPRTFDLRELLRDAQPMLEQLCRPTKLDLITDSRPALVAGNPVELEQMFLNLVTNAVEASHVGDHVTIELHATGGDEIMVEVRDQGDGMPEEIAAQIFEPFFSTKNRGSGIGLSTVRHVVEKHGGTIEVSSRPGEGTSFRIRLSRSSDPAPSAGAS